MIVFSEKEMQGLRQMSMNKRREKLRRMFLGELDSAEVALDEAVEFFDQGFDAALTLPSMNDQEILKLCRIAIGKKEPVASTDEFERCKREQKWPGRSLYLSAALEKLAENNSLVAGSERDGYR